MYIQSELLDDGWREGFRFGYEGVVFFALKPWRLVKYLLLFHNGRMASEMATRPPGFLP